MPLNLYLNLPESAVVNKFIAKTKFYGKVSVSSKIQNNFANLIKKITWQYKLSEATIGISKTEYVTEIQIFDVELKQQVIPENCLKTIDTAIPYQILYRFIYKNNIAYGIGLKGVFLRGEPCSLKYYFSKWNQKMSFDFLAVDLEKVYLKIVTLFLANKVKAGSDFNSNIEMDTKIRYLEKEINVLKKKIIKEKQFNRKVELNGILLSRQAELNKLKGES